MQESDSTDPNAGFPVDALDYALPEALIAQDALPDRSASRLLVVRRSDGQLIDSSIRELPNWLEAGDALVVNDTRVLPAKFALRRSTGGMIDALFVREESPGKWDVLLRGANRLRIGEVLTFATEKPAPQVSAVERGERGRWRIAVDDDRSAAEILTTVGRMPLPPYIKRGKHDDERDARDCDRYQTVFANRDGAIAAPTAGLHLTDAMLQTLQRRNIAVHRITLHVGYGTFAPVEADNLANHVMHSEEYELNADTASALRDVRKAGGRVVAVGTTSARVLETTWRQNQWSVPSAGSTNLFCYPPYTFGGVDVLLTNFHLPRSTLIALVMAFAGVELTRSAYAHAVDERYRFYSYGDAMLLL